MVVPVPATPGVDDVVVVEPDAPGLVVVDAPPGDVVVVGADWTVVEVVVELPV